MNHNGDTCGAEEQTRKRRHHLPETAELAVAGEQRAGVTEPAWSLCRIGDDGDDCADSSLRRIT